VVDPNQNDNLGKYQVEVKSGEETKQIEVTIDLSQFTLVATTSTSNPQLSKELRDKLKNNEPFFDKYF
jgi:Holliday junction resolvasome RuvABC ATP-dependent DNA helicase subunit